MTDEILYYHGLCYTDCGIDYLRRFSFSVFAGELVEVVCMHEHEKEQLILLLNGSLPVDSGEIYGRGSLMAEPSAELKRFCYIVRESSSIVGGLTAGENIFVLRPQQRRRLKIDAKKLREQTQSIFDEFEIPVSPDTPGSRLTDIQKYMVELVKAYTSGSPVVFVDTAAKHFSEFQQDRLQHLYSRLTERGMSMIFFTTHPLTSPKNFDRVAVYDAGRILRCYAGGDFTDTEYRRFRVAPSGLAAPEKRSPSGGEPALHTELPDMSFTVRRGEILGIHDATGECYEQLFDALTQRRPGFPGMLRGIFTDGVNDAYNKGVVFVNQLDIQQNIVPNISLLDNIFLSAYRRVTAAGVFRPKLMRHAAAKYEELFGLKSGGLGENPKIYDYQLNLKLYLERVALSRPKVVICRDPYEKSADQCRRILDGFMTRMAAEGAAVVLCSASANTLCKICARVITPSEL